MKSRLGPPAAVFVAVAVVAVGCAGPHSTGDSTVVHAVSSAAPAKAARPSCGTGLRIAMTGRTRTHREGYDAGAVLTVTNRGSDCVGPANFAVRLVFTNGMHVPATMPASGAMARRFSYWSRPISGADGEFVFRHRESASMEVHWTPPTAGRCWGGAARFRVIQVRFPNSTRVIRVTTRRGLSACKGDTIATTAFEVRRS
jgi:hypothetical protein